MALSDFPGPPLNTGIAEWEKVSDFYPVFLVTEFDAVCGNCFVKNYSGLSKVFNLHNNPTPDRSLGECHN